MTSPPLNLLAEEIGLIRRVYNVVVAEKWFPCVHESRLELLAMIEMAYRAGFRDEDHLRTSVRLEAKRRHADGEPDMELF